MGKRRGVDGRFRADLFRLLYGVDERVIEGETVQEDDEPIISPRRSKMLGTRNPRAKLSDDQVRQAVRMYRDGKTQREIAEQLGCTRQNISSIVRGRTRR